MFVKLIAIVEQELSQKPAMAQMVLEKFKP